MRKARNHGFVVSLLVNMAFRAEWLVPALILLVLHFVLGIAWWWCLIPIGCWIIHALIVTLLLSFANWAGNAPEPQTKNINPYSNKGSSHDLRK